MSEEFYQSPYTGEQIDVALGRVINGDFDDAVTAAEAAQQAAEQAKTASEAVLASEAARNVWEAYDSTKAYVPGNKVSYGGSSYVNKTACRGIVPTDGAHWLCIAQAGKVGPSGDGSGDMVAATYDPQGRRTDVFAYVDDLVGEVGQALGVLLYGEEDTSDA